MEVGVGLVQHYERMWSGNCSTVGVCGTGEGLGCGSIMEMCVTLQRRCGTVQSGCNTVQSGHDTAKWVWHCKSGCDTVQSKYDTTAKWVWHCGSWLGTVEVGVALCKVGVTWHSECGTVQSGCDTA